MDGFFADLGQTYKKAVRAFYDAGCRYLQFDDTVWAVACTWATSALLAANGVVLGGGAGTTPATNAGFAIFRWKYHVRNRRDKWLRYHWRRRDERHSDNYIPCGSGDYWKRDFIFERNFKQ